MSSKYHPPPQLRPPIQNPYAKLSASQFDDFVSDISKTIRNALAPQPARPPSRLGTNENPFALDDTPPKWKGKGRSLDEGPGIQGLDDHWDGTAHAQHPLNGNHYQEQDLYYDQELDTTMDHDQSYYPSYDGAKSRNADSAYIENNSNSPIEILSDDEDDGLESHYGHVTEG